MRCHAQGVILMLCRHAPQNRLGNIGQSEFGGSEFRGRAAPLARATGTESCGCVGQYMQTTYNVWLCASDMQACLCILIR